MLLSLSFLVALSSFSAFGAEITRLVYNDDRINESYDFDGKDFLDKFYRYDEIIGFMKRIARENHDITELNVIGHTYERRPIYALRISNDFSAMKPVVMIEAGIHAREWAAPPMAMYIISRIVDEDKDLLNDMDWYVVPCANPDGYEYTHTNERFWRKNRAPSNNSECPGVDLNRNFGINWGKGSGSSNNTCRQTFHGAYVFSEEEAKALHYFVHKYKDRVKAYLAIHSYGSLISYPYAFKNGSPSNKDDLENCGQKAASAISNAGGPKWEVGNSGALLGLAPGGADDYMVEAFGIAYVYTVELPAGGRFNFDLPKNEIKPMVEHTYPGIKTLATCWIND